MTSQNIESILPSSPWNHCPHQALEFDEFDSIIWAIKVENNNAFEMWQWLRSQVDTLQGWPLITIAWGGKGHWSSRIQEEFTRWPFGHEPHRQPGDSVTPSAVIQRSQEVSLEQFWPGLLYDFDPVEMAEAQTLAIEETQAIYGMAPNPAEIEQAKALGRICDRLSLERWFFDWEEQHQPHRQLTVADLSYMGWFDPADQGEVIVLLPIPSGAESLAYLQWYAAETLGSDPLIAVLKAWEQMYGAELVAHFGTMLQFIVSRPPQTVDQAFELAVQHDAVAPCTLALPGISLREHARALMQTNQWSLHERP